MGNPKQRPRQEITAAERAWILDSPHFWILPMEQQVQLAHGGDQHAQSTLLEHAAWLLRAHVPVHEPIATFLADALERFLRGDPFDRALGKKKRGIKRRLTQHEMRQVVFAYEWGRSERLSEDELIALIALAMPRQRKVDPREVRKWRGKLLAFDADRMGNPPAIKNWLPQKLKDFGVAETKRLVASLTTQARPKNR